jgi:O-antigen/teichoic acid export membrane protein
MSEQLKQLGKHTLVYTAGIILGRIASFVMLPVYTRYLTPADYGVLELLGMTIDVIGMITGVGIVAGVFKFYSEENDRAEKNAVISTAALSVAGLATATGVVGLAVAPALSKLVFGAESNPLYLRLYFLVYLIQNFEYLPFLLMRAENRSVLFVTVNFAKLIVLVLLNILFLVHFQMGIVGILASNIIATTAVATGLTGYLIRRVGIRFSKEKFRRMLRFGSGIVPWSLASFVLVFSDRFFLNYYTNTATVGLYALAYKFAWMLTVLAYTPFETIWTAQRFEVAKQPDAQAVYARVFRYMNLVLGAIALVLCLFIRDFLSLMSSPEFLPAYRLVPLLVAAQIVFTWAAYWSTGIYISGRTKVMATGSIVLVGITLLLNYLLIPWLGAFGAAWATLGAYAARFFWTYHFAQRDYPIRYDWTEMTKLYAVLGAAVALKFAYHPSTKPASMGWSAAILLTAIYLVYVIALPADDRQSLRALVGRYLSSGRLRERDGMA